MKKLHVLLFAAALATTSITVSAKSNSLILPKSTTIVADSVDLSEYVGKFKLAEGAPVEAVIFIVKDGKLVAQAGEYPEAVLNLKIKDQFEDSGMGAVFTFSRTENKVVKVKIEVQGIELFAEKVEEEKK